VPPPASVSQENTPLDLAVSVTRQVQISGPVSWEHLVCGVDTLDLGLHVGWGNDWPRLDSALAEGKKAAETTIGIAWQFGRSAECLIRPNGKPPMYRYHLQSADFNLFIGQRPFPKEGTPNVFASILAKSLWKRGVAAAVEHLIAFVESLGGRIQACKVSRVDLAADFHIPGGLNSDFLLRCRVAKSSAYRVFADGDHLETFYIGSPGAAVLARIYDKSREVLSDPHQIKMWFFEDVWKRKPGKDIWRVEFQLRREILRELQCDTFADLVERASGVWKYLTEDWLTLRLLDNENVSRRTINQWWSAVQEVGGDFGGSLAVTREYAKGGEAPADWYIAHGAGCLAGYAARKGVKELDKALADFARAMREHLGTSDFGERFRVERIRLGFDDAGTGGESCP
jgi:hypothetical protein